jgi:hypothetical protein
MSVGLISVGFTECRDVLLNIADSVIKAITSGQRYRFNHSPFLINLIIAITCQSGDNAGTICITGVLIFLD